MFSIDSSGNLCSSVNNNNFLNFLPVTLYSLANKSLNSFLETLALFGCKTSIIYKKGIKIMKIIRITVRIWIIGEI